MNETEVLARIRPGRTITGMSAVLLPFTADGEIDWDATEAHIDRTVDVGLTPAVNMDTGYVQLLTDDQKTEVLDLTAVVAGSDFVAGAYVADQPGAAFDLAGYLAACDAIATRGGTPVIFPSYGLNSLDDDGWVDALAAIGTRVDRFIGFELGAMFVPYGRMLLAGSAAADDIYGDGQRINLTSLAIYLSVLATSALLALHAGLVDPATRLWRARGAPNQ